MLTGEQNAKKYFKKILFCGSISLKMRQTFDFTLVLFLNNVGQQTA